MVKRKKLLVVSLPLIAIIIVVLFLVRDGFQLLVSKPFQQKPTLTSSWEQVFKNPLDVKLTTLVTGVVEGDRFIVLDQTDASVKNINNRFEPSVVMSHWMQHPIKGNFLIDAGLSKEFSVDGGNYNYLLRLTMHLIGVNTKQWINMDSATQLMKKRITPKAIFLTHLHADHTSGIADFAKDTQVIFGKKEPIFIQKAMMGTHLLDKQLFTIDFKDAVSIPPFDKVLDLFGDGSFWAISTHGHSPDHISYLINTKTGPKLITGDASAYYAQLKYKIRPTQGIYDFESAIKSLSQLSEFVTRYPNVEVFVGHELSSLE